MKNYSISQAAAKLDMSRDTLRYYDALGLVSPLRGENRYRYYTDAELSDLMYIRVMKFAGFSLEEIQVIFRNMHTADRDCRQDTLALLEYKQKEIQAKICRLQESLELITRSAERVKKKTCQNDITELVTMIYDRIQPADHSNKLKL